MNLEQLKQNQARRFILLKRRYIRPRETIPPHLVQSGSVVFKNGHAERRTDSGRDGPMIRFLLACMKNVQKYIKIKLGWAS